MSTTALTIITGAYLKLGVYGLGETPGAAQAAEGLRLLNMMMSALGLQSLTKPVEAREPFPLVSGKGGPSNPYTIGPGGDFNTQRPQQNDLIGAGLILGGNTPTATVEIPRAVLTNDAYRAIQIKEQQNALFTDVYYNATWAGGLGTINLWPVPNTALHSLVLYLLKSLTSFSSLAASYETPPGLDELLEYNLALRLATPSQREAPADVVNMAMRSLADFKRANVILTDLSFDPAVTNNQRGGYNINTGQGG